MLTNILIYTFLIGAIFFILAGIAVQIYLFIILPAKEERRLAKRSKEVARLIAENELKNKKEDNNEIRKTSN